MRAAPLPTPLRYLSHASPALTDSCLSSSSRAMTRCSSSTGLGLSTSMGFCVAKTAIDVLRALCGQPGNKHIITVPGTFRAPSRGSLGPQEATERTKKHPRKNTQHSLGKKSCLCGAPGRGGCPGHLCGAKSRAAAAPGLPHGHLSARRARAGHGIAIAPLHARLSTLGEVKRALESAYTRGGERGEAGLRWASGC